MIKRTQGNLYIRTRLLKWSPHSLGNIPCHVRAVARGPWSVQPSTFERGRRVLRVYGGYGAIATITFERNLCTEDITQGIRVRK